MRKWMAAAVLSVLAAATAARGGGEAPGIEPGGPALDRFLFFAVLEGACEDALPDEAAKAALAQDGKGRYRHFVYACPVCSPVVEALRAYAMRQDFYYSRKGDPMVDDRNPSPVADLAGRLAGKEPKAQGAALKALVERWVKRRMERLRLTDLEKARWQQAMEEGRKKGMSGLPRSEGFEHRSCPSCDGASGNEFEK